MNRRNGQAVLEFIVALVAIIIVFAGLLQVGLLAKIHTDIMTEARREAGRNALNPVLGGPQHRYISEWRNGPDEVNYSADDEFESGSILLFNAEVIDRARPLELISWIGDSDVSRVHYEPFWLLCPLEHGQATRNVPLLPVIRHMAYAADSIDLECTVWMVTGGGIY